ncbi:MAG TPA: exopolysaccharide Pel transporter PelG [Polyangiales bacterium]|nr:exopolysaccharide Pel transporter PelG [Polyangiales bacterium]
MAGIGFSLRALSERSGYLGALQCHAAAALISCGPWLLSTLAVLGTGRLLSAGGVDARELGRFQVAVSWLFVSSLIWTAPFQLMFTRFVADREYAGERAYTLPNLCGALACVCTLSAALSCLASRWFASESLLLRAALGTAFVAVCGVWLVSIVLVELREQRKILGCLALGYLLSLGACWSLARWGAAAMLAGFALGQAGLLFVSLAVLARALPVPLHGVRVSFAFLRRRALFFDLGLIGLLYNAGSWADELSFWLDPATSRAVLGPLRASPFYDLPSFAAGLCAVPGMAVFLLRVETDFAERQRAFGAALRAGASLPRLEALREALAAAAQRGIAALLRVQVLSWLACLGAGAPWLGWLAGEPGAAWIELQLPLFYLAALAAGLQLLVLASISFMFHLDRRGAALRLSLLLCLSNTAASWFTQRLGPAFYGYGVVAALALTSAYGLSSLNRIFAQLVRDTFVLQPGAAG